MRIVLAFGVGAFAVANAAESHPPTAHASPVLAKSIPFELTNGHIFVTASVNGHGPYRFAIDTGASGMGRADTRLAQELSLRTVDQAANSDGIKVASTPVVVAHSLRLGGIERRDVHLLSRDYNGPLKPGVEPLMGIIGRDFFADRLVTVDYPARRIRFARGSLRRGERGVVAYKDSFAIPVCVAAGCFPGKVDTGSSRTLVFPKDLLAKLSASAPVAIGQAKRTNSSATLCQMTLNEPVRVAGVTATRQKVFYADPSDVTINIGSEFLQDYVLTIDQRHHLLRIVRPTQR